MWNTVLHSKDIALYKVIEKSKLLVHKYVLFTTVTFYGTVSRLEHCIYKYLYLPNIYKY